MKVSKRLVGKISCLLVLIIASMSALSACSNSYNYSKELIKAIQQNDVERFDELIEQEGDLNSTPYFWDLDRVNLPPLHYACKEGKYEFVVKLVEAGANVNNTDHSIKTTPLMETLDSGNDNRFEIANYLIESGADVNIKAYNSTALDYVFTYNCENYNEEVEKEEYDFAIYLIEQGAFIDAVLLGNVIFNAARMNNVLMVDYLIEERNVNIDLQDVSYANTPLIWAVKFDCYNVAQYLIESGANVDITNKDGKTAHDLALESNNEQIIGLFELGE